MKVSWAGLCLAGLLCLAASPPAAARVTIANGTEDRLPATWRQANRLRCDHEVNQRLARDGTAARAKSVDMSKQGFGRIVDFEAGRVTLLIPSHDGFPLGIGLATFEPDMRQLVLILMQDGAVWMQMNVNVDNGHFSSVSLDPDQPVVVYGQCAVENDGPNGTVGARP
jgi:hypothetical protein